MIAPPPARANLQRMLERLVHTVAGPFRAWGAMRRLRREALRMHLGHDKVIGWEDGSPVHSLFIPGEYGEPMVRSRARMFNLLRFGRSAPLVCALGMTNACQCRCSHCSAHGQPDEELSTAEWKRAIDDVLELGVYLLIFTGGEALLRPDLPELIAHVDRRRAVPVLFSNGLRLAERAGELRRAGLSRVFASFDVADAARHDAHRGVPGTFAAAAAGLAACRRLGMLTGVSTFADPERLADGTLDGLVGLAREQRVNELAIFDALPTGRWSGRHAIPPDGHPYYDELRRWVEAQQARTRFGIWSYRQVRSWTSCGCSAGTTTFKIASNGDVQPCDFCHRTIGNLRREPLPALWQRLNAMARREGAQGAGCWLLRDLHARPEISLQNACASS